MAQRRGFGGRGRNKICCARDQYQEEGGCRVTGCHPRRKNFPERVLASTFGAVHVGRHDDRQRVLHLEQLRQAEAHFVVTRRPVR